MLYKLTNLFSLKKWTLKIRLTVVFSILCILAMGILLSITLPIYSTQMTRHIYENELDTLKNCSILLDSNLEKYSKLSKQVFANSKIRSILETPSNNNNPEQNRQELREVKNVFRDVVYNLAATDVTSIVICSKNGRIYSSYDLSGNINSYQNTFYDKIISSEDPMVIFPTDNYGSLRSKATDTFAIGRLIRNDRLEETGYLLIFISSYFFEKNLSKSNLKDTTSYYIFSDENRIMYKQECSSLSGYTDELLKEALADTASNTMTISKHGRKFLITKYVAEYSDWTMVSISDLSEITGTINHFIRLMIFVFFIIAAVIFLVALLIAREISQPLNDIQNVMVDVSSGDMSLRISEFSSPDFNNLAVHFNSMLDQIEVLMDENTKKQQELIKTELQMLRAQINPHFIYNTLNSISWLAIFNGQPQIKKQLDNLTTLLRSAYSDPDQLITLAYEKEIIICYTNIMKLRYDNFSLIFEDKPEDADCLIPKCTLQPIVENSIIHGFPAKKDACIIRISFIQMAADGILKIIVSDNGVGMNREQREKLLSSSSDTTKFNNIGIQNVDKRIKLKFGPSYGLTITSEENIGTDVTITLPLLYKESE